MKKSKLKFFLYFVLILYAIIQVFPIIWIMYSSFVPSSAIYDAPMEKLTASLTLENYINYFTMDGFVSYLKNSLIVTISSVIIGVVGGVPLAFQLTKRKFKLKDNISFWVLTLIMLPPVVVIIPLYTLFVKVNLVGSLFALIIAHSLFALPFVTWLTQSFINDVPDAIEEAALIDGASSFTLLTKIIIPAIMPGLMTVSFFVFMFTWNEYLISALLSDNTTQTLQVFIGGQVTDASVIWDVLLPGSVISLLPLIIVSFILQKYLARGFSLGAFK